MTFQVIFVQTDLTPVKCMDCVQNAKPRPNVVVRLTSNNKILYPLH